MPHVVVIGAGVFGVWSAYHLHAAGYTVTLVDAFDPGHSRSSSGDESRILRCGYGADELYSEMAARSLRVWRETCDGLDPAQPLFHACGVLWLADSSDPYTQATRRTLQQGSHSLAMLDAAALQNRYPHLRADDIGAAVFEPDAGVIMARRAVRLLAFDLSRRGVHLRRAQAMPPRAPGPLRSIALAGGGAIEGDAFIFACGAWLPRVFPELLDGVIRPTRQVVMYFGAPAGDSRFAPEHTPAWVDFPAGIYGIPDLEGRGVKVGIDRHGPPMDPDADDRIVDAVSVRTAREWLQRRFPALADAPVVESRVCQYENSTNGDFVIDRHPQHANAIIAGGGSGHGFKHGPAVGEHVARLLDASAAPAERFTLRSKPAAPQRTVF